MITIIGLGAQKGDVTQRALDALRRADRVLVRTAAHPSVQSLREAGIPFETLDALYERCRTYETLTRAIVREVRRAGREGNVCYCVDGSVTEDGAARALATGRTAVIDGVSKASAAAACAGVFGAYTAMSAYEAAERELTAPLVLYDLADRSLASDVKLALAERFGDEADVALVAGGKVKKIKLYELDRQSGYTVDTALVLYDVPLLQKKRFDLYDLLAILRRLRAPDGCPWDRVQTHESIRINCLEEAYELVDAIDLDDPDKMCEEAGDVLMQAAFHTLIEEERGHFTMTDVVSGTCEKLITRHTHVFGQDKASEADGALTVWEKNKMKEKHQETFSDAVEDVPAVFPALLRAQKIAKRTEKGGWKFASFDGAVSSLRTSLEALKAANEAGDGEQTASLLGEALMCMAWLGRAVGVDCEQALLDTVKKMQQRYVRFETIVRADGKDVNALSPEEFENYYQEAMRG